MWTHERTVVPVVAGVVVVVVTAVVMGVAAVWVGVSPTMKLQALSNRAARAIRTSSPSPK
jgi:hypothetical protein